MPQNKFVANENRIYAMIGDLIIFGYVKMLCILLIINETRQKTQVPEKAVFNFSDKVDLYSFIHVIFDFSTLLVNAGAILNFKL